MNVNFELLAVAMVAGNLVATIALYVFFMLFITYYGLFTTYIWLALLLTVYIVLFTFSVVFLLKRV